MANNSPGPVRKKINWAQYPNFYDANITGPKMGPNIPGIDINNPYPSSARKGINWTNVGDKVAGIVPYASNIANAFRRAPRPAQPTYLKPVTLSKPSFQNERNDVTSELAGLNKSYDQSLDSNAAAAAKAGALVGALKAKGRSYENEANTGANIANEQAQINAGIDAQNAQKTDIYHQQQTEAQIANQVNASENVSNAADKFIQGQYRTDMMNMDKTKFGILSQAYANSGVTDRLVRRILGKNPGDQVSDEEMQSVLSGTRRAYGGKLMKVYAAGGGLSRSQDYGSSSNPYPSVDASDFAGGGRSYPIPTEADAVDALRLAHLHGREDVIAKVHAKYPELHAMGGELNDSENDNDMDDIKAKGGWIAGAVNPAHKGYCTPMSKATCTGHRRAFAEMMKKKHGFHAAGGELTGGPGVGDPGLGKKMSSTYKTQAEVNAANDMARNFALRRNLVPGQNAYVARKAGDPVVPFVDTTGKPIGQVGQPSYPAGMKTSLGQIPSYVTGLEWDSQSNLPYYNDEKTGDLQYVHPDIFYSSRFNPNRGKTALPVATHAMGGNLMHHMRRKSNRMPAMTMKNVASTPPEMQAQYMAMGGHLFHGVQFPKMRGKIRKVR